MKSKEIIEQLSSEIRRGDHGMKGTAFSTVRELCERFDISLVTAHRIVRELVDTHLLIRSGLRMTIAAERLSNLGPLRIGVLAGNLDNPFFSRLLNGIEAAGRKHGVEIITAGSDYNTDHEAAQLRMLAQSGANAFLIAPAHDTDSAQTLRALEHPFVLIGRRVHSIDTDVVMVNNFAAGALVAEHLLNKQCRNFLYVGLRNTHNDMRSGGFFHRLREAEFYPTEENTVLLDFDHDDGSLARALRTLPSNVKTGIFCYHDLFALRTIRTARLCGKRVPDEISVVGFDNLPIAVETYPSLSSISYPIAQIAENALILLLRRVEHELTGVGSIHYIEPTLIARESSSAPATREYSVINL